jgi:histidyl-tRNA synthetase
LSKQLEAGAKAQARWAVILGDGPSDRVILRDLDSGDQRELNLSEVLSVLSAGQ